MPGTPMQIPEEDLPATLEAKNRCPWCGEHFDTIHDHSDETDCEHCGRPFAVEVVTTYLVKPQAPDRCLICNETGLTANGYVCSYCRGTKVRLVELRYGAPTAPACPVCKGDGGVADPKWTEFGIRFTIMGARCPACAGSGRAVPVRKIVEEVDEKVE